ncbi:MAG: helix-turn-helix transcriptional regulator [Gemmatimonadota bacterium]
MPVTGRMKPHWFHILLSVADQSLHGTAIMEEVLDRTDGELRLWPGMLYGSLRELTDSDFIAEVEPPPDAPIEGGKRRFYRITPRGRVALLDEVERLSDLVRAARAKQLDPKPERA